jgi:hypothetical protein
MGPDQMGCDLNQFLAATGTNYLPQVQHNRAISDFNFPASFRILERTIAESANWKLSLAESSERKKTASP